MLNDEIMAYWVVKAKRKNLTLAASSVFPLFQYSILHEAENIPYA